MLGHVAKSVGAALPAVAREAKAAQFTLFASAGAETWTAPADGRVTLRMLGGGGGGYNSADRESGGGGGAFLQKSFVVRKGDQLSLQIGAGGSAGNGGAGGNTTALLPNGSQLRAGGGSGGTVTATGIATGGTATGGDVNNSGGRGGKRATTALAERGSGVYGGPPGTQASGEAFRTGGGPGGPDQYFPKPIGYGGSTSGSPFTPPALGGGGGHSQAGAGGYIELEFVPS